MRVLFVVPPLAGHVNPTVAVAAELAARGHQVAWTGPAAALTPRGPPGGRGRRPARGGPRPGAARA
ncbi:glycosyltransferase, partial [Streptomyces inhibens]